jgi:hypothetical protein
MDELETHITYGSNLAEGGPTPGREEKLLSSVRTLRKKLEESLAREANAKINPFFGLFSRREEAPVKRRKQSKRGSKKKEEVRFYIAFTDVCKNTRDFYVLATGKADALVRAKRLLREDGENLQGAQWHVERED